MAMKEGSENFDRIFFNLDIFEPERDTLYISRVSPLIKGAYVDIEFDKAQTIREIILNTRTWPKIYAPARYVPKVPF